MTKADLAKYLTSLADSERALGAMGNEYAPYAAKLLDYLASTISAGASPVDSVARLADMSADMQSTRAAVAGDADKKFGGAK